MKLFLLGTILICGGIAAVWNYASPTTREKSAAVFNAVLSRDTGEIKNAIGDAFISTTKNNERKKLIAGLSANIEELEEWVSEIKIGLPPEKEKEVTHLENLVQSSQTIIEELEKSGIEKTFREKLEEKILDAAFPAKECRDSEKK